MAIDDGKEQYKGIRIESGGPDTPVETARIDFRVASQEDILGFVITVLSSLPETHVMAALNFLQHRSIGLARERLGRTTDPVQYAVRILDADQRTLIWTLLSADLVSYDDAEEAADKAFKDCPMPAKSSWRLEIEAVKE